MNQNLYVQKKQTENTQEYPYQERACRNTEKAFVSAEKKRKERKKERKKTERAKQKRKKYIKKDKFALKQTDFKWTINRELPGTQFD